MENNFNVLAIRRHRFATDGQGITTLIGLSNCPLDCKYCLNKEVVSKNKYKVYSVDDLLREIMIDYCYFIATNGGVTFGGAEPLLHSKAIREFAQKIPQNMQINIETSLNVPNELLKEVFPYISLFIIDIKTMNKEIYKNYTKKDMDNVLLNLQYIVDNNYQDKCKIRIPLIPNYNDEEDQKKSKKILEEMGFGDFDIFDYIIRHSNKMEKL